MGSFLSGAREIVRVINLPCREHSLLISRGTDGEIPPSTHIGLRMHYILCAPCRHFSAQLRFLRRAASRLAPVAIERAVDSARMPEEVRARIRERLKR